MRAVGLSFSVYLSTKIGTAGMGLYQLILSVYTLCVTVSTSGINLASTRMVAEALGGRREDQSRAIMRRCLSYSIFLEAVPRPLCFSAQTMWETYGWPTAERSSLCACSR